MVRVTKATLWRLAAAATSAVLMWSAFASRGEAMNVCFALAPMLLLSRVSPRRVSARWWFVSGLGFWLATLSWMPAIVKNGGPWPLVALGWGALAAYCALFHGLYGWLLVFAREALAGRRGARAALLLLVEPVLWAFLEWARGNLFGGFAWNFLGVAAAEVPVCASPASLGGVYLVSFFVLLVNGVIATVAERAIGPMLGRPRAERTFLARFRRALETGVPLALTLAGIAAAGFQSPTLCKGWLQLRVALVQRDFPCVFQPGGATDPFEVYTRLLSTAALANPQLTVFSESAMNEFGRARSRGAVDALAAIRERTGLRGYVLAGADDRVETNGATRVYNAAALYPEQGAIQVYHKQHRVPFGEFIPLDKVFPALQKLAPVGSLHPGEPKLLDLEVRDGEEGASWKLRLAPLICYEDTDSDLARRAARDGANLFAFITNDSWFSESAETVQHFRQSVLRCVETGRFAVRTGNSGVTAVIYPSGRYAALSDANDRFLVDAAGAMTHTIRFPCCNPTRPIMRTTLYTRCGDVPLLTVSGLLLFSIFALAWRRRV